MPKISSFRIFGHPFFQERWQYIQTTCNHVNMYYLIEKRHTIHVQGLVGQMEMKILRYLLEIDIFGNFSVFGCPDV